MKFNELMNRPKKRFNNVKETMPILVTKENWQAMEIILLMLLNISSFSFVLKKNL